MKLSREWLHDYVDLTGLSDDEIATRMTEIGHAIESVERHGDDTVFDAEITTNRIDAMSHLGMARELAAAFGRELRPEPLTKIAPLPAATAPVVPVTVRIEVPQLCHRFSGMVVRGVTVKPSPAWMARRLEAVGLRPISNVVDVSNYVMLSVGHPLHTYDLDRVNDATIIVRAGRPGEAMRTLDGEKRVADPDTVVIADGRAATGLGGIMGGAESEIGATTKNVLIECAWFDPSSVRRTARRLGMKTDASYRYERRVDPGDTLDTATLAARMILELAGGTVETPIDVVAIADGPKTLRLRGARLREASGGVIGPGYALDLFRRVGFGVKAAGEDLEVTVPTYRGDIFEEMDLVEEVIRFYGIDRIPSSLPRLTTGDARENVVGDAEDRIRDVLVGCGLTEVVNYAFIHPEYNPLFSTEQPPAITNALNENLGAMRLSLIPGLLESVAYNRSYGTRDGALFEVGRTYHRAAEGGVVERSRAAVVLFGGTTAHWGEARRAWDFFDIKGIVEQVARSFHVDLETIVSDEMWLRKGKRALVRHGDRIVGHLGAPSAEVLARFGVKGDVFAAEIDVPALLASTAKWTMTDIARFPGVPMVLGVLHARELPYQKIVETIRGMNLPYLHEVGLRDRFVADETKDEVKTTLGMWYQALDRSLTQEEVAAIQQQLATRLAESLPVRLLTA